MTVTRQWREENAQRVAKIQGAANGYKTVCTSSVLAYFGVDRSTYRYAQTITDAVNVLRRQGHSVRSRKSVIGNKCTIGKLRKLIRSGKLVGQNFIVRVDGHAMVVDGTGATAVDTDPRRVDRRTITHIYLVEKTL